MAEAREKEADTSFIGATILQSTGYAALKNDDNTVYNSPYLPKGMILTRLPTGEYALFSQIHEFADAEAPGVSPNYDTSHQPINPASTDIKFKAYVRLDPKGIGLKPGDLDLLWRESGNKMILMQPGVPARLDGIKNVLEQPDNIRAQNLLKESNGRPVLRMAYGGWGQLIDPGGSDAVYTLNFRGINYQLQYTIPTAHVADEKMLALTNGEGFDVEIFGHSIGAGHIALLGELEGAGKLGSVLPGAKNIHLEEHEPVGGANASAVIARTMGHALFPHSPNPEVTAAESIENHIDMSLVLQSTGAGKPQPIIMRAYETYFDARGSNASGRNINCLLFDGGGKTWRINDLDASNGAHFLWDTLTHVPDFVTGIMPHFSNKMASILARDWQKSLIPYTENHKLCPEIPLKPEILASLGTDPGYKQTGQMIRWDYMLRHVQESLIDPPAKKILEENGSPEMRPPVNGHTTPFAEIFAQLGYKDESVGTSVRDHLMLFSSGNDPDPKNVNLPSYAVQAHQLKDGGWALQIEDMNKTPGGAALLSSLLQGGKETLSLSVDRMGGQNTRLSKISISVASVDELGAFLDDKLGRHNHQISNDLKHLAAEKPIAPQSSPQRPSV